MPGRPAVLVLGAIALGALLLPAAQAQTAGWAQIDARAEAGPLRLAPGPVPVPSPVLPNPAYDVLQAGEPAFEPLPAGPASEEDGLYARGDDGPSQRLVPYGGGVEERRIAPVEALDATLGVAPGLPVSVDSSTRVAPPATLAEVPLGAVPLPAARAAAPAGVPARAHPRSDEAVPAEAGVEFVGAEAAPYEPLLPFSAEPGAAAAEASRAPGPSGGGAVLAAALVAGAALLLLLLPLYHRFRRRTALDNPTRQRLYELLRSAPGASAAELGASSGLHVTTVKYHLDVLRRVGLVGEQSIDGCRRFYSYENGDRLEFLQRALLDEPSARAIYGQIEAVPGLPFIEVARAVGMRKEHVHYHVQKLAKHGLIVDRWEGGRRLLFPARPAGHVANGHAAAAGEARGQAHGAARGLAAAGVRA